jgi:hypothetical protein
MTLCVATAATLAASFSSSVLTAQGPRDLRSTPSSSPPIEVLYAAAAVKLLGPPGNQEFVLLPTPLGGQHGPRARPGSGEKHTASSTTVRQVTRLLERQGYSGARAVQAAGAPPATLQLVLGPLRFEPASDPHFARLGIEVIGSDGSRVGMEFLVKREAQGWRAIEMESEDNIG